MILNKIQILVFFLLLGLGAFAQKTSQNIYDFEHSKEYAGYLMNSRQYDFAAEEYERLVFMKPEDSAFKILLLTALRKNESYEKGISKWNYFQSENTGFDESLNAELIKILLLADSLEQAIFFTKKEEFLDPVFAGKAEVYAAALQLKTPLFEKVEQLSEAEKFNAFFTKVENRKSKSPGVATALSVIVPGAGKAYAGQWKDGMISLIFVGLNAWQAQRRFSKDGIKNPWAWFHAGVGTGFYIGNIYGSHKAARRYNQKQKSILKHEAQTLVFPFLD